LGGDDRADARLVERPGCERADVGEDLAHEFGCFVGRAWIRRARLRSTILAAS
jgi:hypothetical protein